ncbi:MAG: hypothetical protein J5552_04985 [Prevotella sp.]|nr:hypothetical protein [Prevotella sp.]
MSRTLFFVASLLLSISANKGYAADYSTYLTAARGFTEVIALDDILGDADYYYLLAPAETNELIVGVGDYMEIPSWASLDSKALRYHSAATDPVLDLSNFFTIEKSGNYIGLRNVVYDTDLFQTHDNAGYMYVNTYTDKTLDEWSQLTPTYQDGYWLFESGKYPMSSGNWACGYLGPWNKSVALGEPIALNRRNTADDEAGHYRLFRIKRTDLMALRLYSMVLTQANGFTEVTSTDDMLTDQQYVYLITSAEQPSLFVGVGKYEAKPGWAGEDTKALRYRQAGNPVADLSNFFTIEKDEQFIGLRNVVHHTSLFQTHDGAGYMYVLTYTEPTMSDWCYLIPTFQNGYWLMENGKYPMSSDADYKGFIGPWNNRVEADEPIAANRTNATDDEAGHYRLWRISRADLFTLMQNVGDDSTADMTWKVANPSFEQGETGWTLDGKDANGNDEFTARDYGMTGKGGAWLMNAYQWWASSFSVSQTVTTLPAGEYELSGMVASWKDRPVTFSANANTTTAYGVHADGGIKVKTTVTIGTDGQMTINAGSTTDWWTDEANATDQDKQGFFKLDDVQLRCTSLFLDALAVRLPNNGTKLVPGQWYYYETDYSTEYVLVGNTTDMVYTTNGLVPCASATEAAVTRQMTLPAGRTYFKTAAEDATLVIAPYRSVEEGTYTAVALNVDGLPNSILGIDLNPDGPGSEGTKKISQYLASKGYDFIGCSEDFNYHGSLIYSLQNDYSWGKERATLSASGLSLSMLLNGFRFDTDGLNLIWKKSTVSASNESWTQWNSLAETDGNQYVKKGFRHYDVQLNGENGPTIDVYVLHMDAGDTNATESRHSQWEQLCDAINASDKTRAKLIIGDTNSRYTREDIITHFINRLSSDFTMSDVWVEFYRYGVYPTTNMGDLTDKSDPTDYSKYEIVDKIIYINPTAANTVQLKPQSFRIEQDYTYDYVDHDGNTKALGDHNPVVVTFKYQMSGDVVAADITLNDADDNATAISNAQGVLANVTLSGRTLVKNNSWNSLCLPFSMTAEQVAEQLAPAALMEFDVDNKWAMVDGQWTISDDGHATGLDGNTLYLNFKNATEGIRAGVPYIIKWANGNDIENPVFSGVTISNTPAAAVQSADESVIFQGTYTPVALDKDDKSNLYIGDGNTLYYPSVDNFKVNAFRAYFHLADGNAARQFVLNIGDGESTGITAPLSNRRSAESEASWHTLDGRPVKGQPTRKGLYIHHGKKQTIQ